MQTDFCNIFEYVIAFNMAYVSERSNLNKNSCNLFSIVSLGLIEKLF